MQDDRGERIGELTRQELVDLSAARELISDGLAALDQDSVVDRGTFAALRSVHANMLAGLADHCDEAIVLHGDAHAANLLAADGRGWVWIGLEETCRGPVAWDLATLTAHYPADEGQAALRSHAAAAGTVVPDGAALAPRRHARELEGAAWSLCMAHLFPAHYADVARRLLATVLAR